MNAATWTAIAAAAVAFAAAVVASVQAGRANSAARRSATAGERSAAAAERANELAEQQAARYAPDWPVRRINRITCEVVNGTGETALDVRVTREDGEPLPHSGADASPESLRAGESMAVPAMLDFLLPGTRMLITWRREGETQDRQHRVLIPRS